MSFTLEQLQEKKRILADKRAALKAEEKYLEEEKARLLAKLRELGFNSLAEAKEALSKMEAEISEKEAELEEVLSNLENSTAESSPTKTIKQEEQPHRRIVIDSIDDL